MASTPQHQGLVARNMGKTFGAITVLRGVNVDVRPGECVALLGENGAGKSTLSSMVAGLFSADPGGQMWWKGQPYAPRSPADALRAGIGLIHQEMRLLPHLTIAENVFVGRLLMKNGRIDMATMEQRAQEQIHRLGLRVSALTKVGSLSVAAQQQVEIAKALTLKATMLILDEPTAALGDEETDQLFAQVMRLKAEGVSFIYVSHRLAEIARICDRIEVLRDGRLVASHASAKLERDLLVKDMVGRSVDRLFPRCRRRRAKLEQPCPCATSAPRMADSRICPLTCVAAKFSDLPAYPVRAVQKQCAPSPASIPLRPEKSLWTEKRFDRNRLGTLSAKAWCWCPMIERR